MGLPLFILVPTIMVVAVGSVVGIGQIYRSTNENTEKILSKNSPETSMRIRKIFTLTKANNQCCGRR